MMQGSAHDGSEGGRTVTVNEDDDGGRVLVSVGDVLIVRLGARLGTGYSWQIVGQNTRLRLLSQTTEPAADQTESGLEHQVFRFKAQTRGDQKLQLRYARPWQKSAPPMKTFHLTVSIRRK